MLSKNVNFKNFQSRKKSKNIKNIKENLKSLLIEHSQLIISLKSSYKNNYNFKKILKLYKNLDVRIIGIGGSILGAKAIYNFLFRGSLS